MTTATHTFNTKTHNPFAHKPNDSFHLKRLKDYFATHDNWLPEIGEKEETRWIGYHETATLKERWAEKFSFYEEEYKGFQIVVFATHYKYRELLDSSGTPIRSGSSPYKVAGFGEEFEYIVYSAVTYEIGSEFDQVANLNWRDQFSATRIGGVANSLEKTIKHIKTKLDLLALILARKEDLQQIANERLLHNQAVNPYNALINDEVFIHAFGRLRKGIIVKTTGSKFVVAYMTPSNPIDLKYKSLPLSRLYVGK